MRVLVCGWASFVDGEATAGDVAALEVAGRWLADAGVPHDVALSPVFEHATAVRYDEVAVQAYTHVLFVCGPVAGEAVRRLHRRFVHAYRVAAGVSVVDPGDPAASGFHTVLARDGAGAHARDLTAYAAPAPPVPVVGVALANPQDEYGAAQAHDDVAAAVQAWLTGLDAARVPVETRLDPRDWRLAARPAQLDALLRRLDVVVASRMHGLVLGLRAGVPVLAVDPVRGGAKVTAQARALSWPAVLRSDEVAPDALDRCWRWCLSAAGRAAAARIAATMADDEDVRRDAVLAALLGPGYIRRLEGCSHVTAR